MITINSDKRPKTATAMAVSRSVFCSRMDTRPIHSGTKRLGIVPRFVRIDTPSVRRLIVKASGIASRQSHGNSSGRASDVCYPRVLIRTAAPAAQVDDSGCSRRAHHTVGISSCSVRTANAGPHHHTGPDDRSALERLAIAQIRELRVQILIWLPYACAQRNFLKADRVIMP